MRGVGTHGRQLGCDLFVLDDVSDRAMQPDLFDRFLRVHLLAFALAIDDTWAFASLGRVKTRAIHGALDKGSDLVDDTLVSRGRRLLELPAVLGELELVRDEEDAVWQHSPELDQPQAPRPLLRVLQRVGPDQSQLWSPSSRMSPVCEDVASSN